MPRSALASVFLILKPLQKLLKFSSKLIYNYSMFSVYRPKEQKTRKIAAAKIMPRPQSRTIPDWLKSFPIQAIALAVILGLIYLAAPESLHKLLDFTLRFSPELKYVDGPPPV